MKDYDAYGREILKIDGYGTHRDTTIRKGQHRYLVWVTNDCSSRSHTAQRKAYRTRWAALRRARALARRGLGTRVTDRLITPGDTGFLADRTHDHCYRMDPDGTLHKGTYEEIIGLNDSRKEANP